MAIVEQFYLLSHIFISLIGAILLLATWYNIRVRFNKILKEDEPQQRVDKGLAYLSAAVFIWVLSGTWGLLAIDGHIENSMLSHAVNSFFSTLNSFFLLLSLFFLDDSPGFIHKNTKNIKRLSIGILAMSALSILFFQLFGDSNNAIQYQFLPDLILSVFTSLLLIVSLYRVFTRRGFRLIAYISVVTVLVMMYSQLPEVFIIMHDTFASSLMKIIAKTSLISIFLVLATNWVIQLASTPKSSEMTLKVSDWSLIVLSVPSKGIYDQQIDFASKTTQFKNLLKFAIRRKLGDSNEQYMEVGNQGEIASQTYLTRIIENINTIVDKDEDDQLERKDLFTFVGQGKYRLRILPENIIIDKALLNEFANDSENSNYKSIVG